MLNKRSIFNWRSIDYIFIFFSAVLIIIVFVRVEAHPDAFLSMKELVQKYGYDFEEYPDLETEDGYYVTLQRIPRKQNETTSKFTQKPVVLLMHGILASADNWIVAGPDKALPYNLVDKGYDVWMGNCRGTRYSRRHKRYDADKDSKYWRYSWNEMGKFDLPVMVDHILNATNQDQLAYIGHSQGTTTFFVLASERPEYNEKINLMIALAPVAFMGNFRNSILRALALNYKPIANLFRQNNIYELLPIRKLIWDSGRIVCSEDSVLRDVCAGLLFLATGPDWEQLDRGMISVLFSKLPDDISLMQIVHFAQGIRSGKFRHFDYGGLKNMAKYKQLEPPDYKLEQISVPVALFYGNNDLIVSKKDVTKLSEKLQNVIHSEELEWKSFSHLDFLIAKDVKEMINVKVMQILKQNRIDDTK